MVMLAVSLLGAAAGTASAQVLNSGARTIALNAILNEGISINLSNHAVNFTLTSASPTNPGNTGVLVSTTWISKPGRDVSLYAFFASAASALTDGAGNNIPSSAFQISDNGTGFVPLTNTVPFGGAGAGVRLWVMTKVMGLNKQGTRQDNLLFNIDLSAVPLPAGTYTGLLTLRAQII